MDTVVRTRNGPSKRTRAMLAAAKVSPALKTLDNIKHGDVALTSYDMIGETLNVLGECLGEFITYARSVPKTPDQIGERLRAFGAAAEIAVRLAPFRYPKFATIKINNDNRGKSLLAPGDTYDSVMADLLAGMKRTGLKPRKMIDVTPTKTATKKAGVV